MSDATKTLGVDDLFKMRFLQMAKFSPDGTKVVYTVSSIGKKKDDDKEDTEFSTIFIHDLTTGERKQMTSGKARDTSPAFSPDGKTLAFVSDRGEKPQIYLLPIDGGEAQALTTLKQGAGAPVWSPDGGKIAFTAGIDYGEDEAPDRSKDPYRVTRNIWRFDAIGDLDMAVNNLYVVDVASEEVTQLSDSPQLTINITWSPDGSKILYGEMMAPDKWRGFQSDYYLTDLEGNRTPIAQDWDTVNNVTWLPDGKSVAFIGYKVWDCPIGTHADLWTLDLESGEFSNRSAELERSICGFLEGRAAAYMQITPFMGISDDGQTLYTQVQDGGQVSLYRFSLTDDVDYGVVVGGERACMLLDMAADTLLFGADSITESPDLYTVKTDGSDEQRLTDLNAEFMADFVAPEVVHLTFKGTDGADVEGWYVKPNNGAEAPYPTVMWIHGGPHGAQGHRFAFDTWMLNSYGYGVMFVNHRASTGYGDAFSTAIKGDWGNLDYGDLMAGVDTAIEQGLADPDKMGICGISGGGNLSTWIVGQTDRFKAAIPQNPVTNWQSFYGVSDIGVWFSVEELGGHPHEIPEVYDRCSPITYAHRCTTPTLLIQTEHDWRCPAEQSEQFYTVLKANGCTVEMLRQPGGSHGGSIRGSLKLRRAHLEAKRDWFNRHILGIETPVAEAE